MSTAHHTQGSDTTGNNEVSKYWKALNEFRKQCKENVFIKTTNFMTDNKLSQHFLKALIELKIIKEEQPFAPVGKKVGRSYKWLYHNASNDPTADSALANKVIEKIKQLGKDAREKLTGKVTKPTTSAVVRKEDFNGDLIAHQIQYLKGELEKEKLVKGYLRPDAAYLYPRILKNLETLKTIKELA